MSAETAHATEIVNDLESLCASAAAGCAVDPVVAQRVHERTEEALRDKEPTNIAVELIREARNQ